MKNIDYQKLGDIAGFLSFQPSFTFNALLDCDKKIIFLETGNQIGKCLHIDEFLYTSEGIQQMSDLKSGDNGLGGMIERGEDFEDDLYEVVFQNGIKIICNKEHPFYSKHSKNINDRKAGFKALKDLKIKEYVFFTPAKEFQLTKKRIKYAKLLGYLCSDGYVNGERQSIHFTNNNISFVKEVADLAKKSFNIDCKWIKMDQNGHRVYLTIIKKGCIGKNKSLIKEYINNLKITPHSFGDIVSGDKRSLTDFIKGYFNGDGYLLIRKRKNGFGTLPSIEIGFSIGNRRKKAYEFQYILWKLGIFSFVVPEKMKGNKDGTLFYRVKVNSWSALDMMNLLDWDKYPDKFLEAREYLENNPYKRKNNRNWISIKKIKYIGKGKLANISTSTEQIFCYCGMKTHNTASVVMSYIWRILGIHPIESKNLRPDNPFRTIRFASEKLPHERNAAGEVYNPIYPQLKKFLPPSLIKRDIVERKPVITLRDPQGGPDIFIEFVSYNQDVQTQKGFQKFSIFLDEEAPKFFYDEQLPRLLASDGDLLFALTPIEYICFDNETEVLTKRGWKGYDEILMNDILLTYNINENCYEWGKMVGFNLQYVVDEEMNHLTNADFDAFITDDHKWVINNVRNDKTYYLEKTRNLNSKHRIKRFSKFKSSTDNVLYSDNFLKLVGWVVTDGSFAKSTTVIIYQSVTAYPKNCEEIRRCLEEYPNMWHEEQREYGPTIIQGNIWNGHGTMCRFYLNGELGRAVKSVADKKIINQEFICSLSVRQLEILFVTMIKGDGYKKQNGSIKFTQTENFKLLESFQLIATLLGYKTTIREDKHTFKYHAGKHRHGVYVWKDSTRYSANVHKKSLVHNKRRYTGYIWCPSTENKTVVMKRNDHVSISGNSWTFEGLYERTGLIYNSPTIIDYLYKKTGRRHLPKEVIESGNKDIAVIRGSSYDNPTIPKEHVDRSYAVYDDPSIVENRLYGIFHQISGTILKEFDMNTHVINKNKFFENGIPEEWLHVRGIDFHEHVNWACGFMALSHTNEAFIYDEYNPSPENMITMQIVEALVKRNPGYEYKLNLIDHLAAKTQVNSGRSPLDDINELFYQFKKEGIGRGGSWQTWDTKSLVGRDRLRERIKNSLLVGRPFNNRVSKKDGFEREEYLPTLWVMDHCFHTIQSFRNWKWENPNKNDPFKQEKNKAEDRYSHFPITFECIMKHPAFNVGRYRSSVIPPRRTGYENYMQPRTM